MIEDDGRISSSFRPPSFARFARSLLSVEWSERPSAAPNLLCASRKPCRRTAV